MSASRRTVDYRVDPFDLHLFTAVVELGSITAAAQAVKLSLAAASARLQALEARAGLPLLLRSKAGATPTDAGRALARQAQRVLAELEALQADLARFGSGLHGTLRLLGNTAAVSQALPAVLPAFLSAHPALDVDVLERSSEATVEALRQGRADLGIVASHVDMTGLVAHRWHDDRLVALVPAGSRLGQAGAVAFSTLLDGPWSACRETVA